MNDYNENKVKLMIVDDVEDVIDYMGSHFRKRGFNVFSAGSAEEALPVIKKESPDIMLLDMNLPKMNGIDLLRLVREFNTGIKVIMVTAYDMDLQKEPELQKLNVLAVMRKPVRIEDLDLNINKIIKG